MTGPRGDVARGDRSRLLERKDARGFPAQPQSSGCNWWAAQSFVGLFALFGITLGVACRGPDGSRAQGGRAAQETSSVRSASAKDHRDPPNAPTRSEAESAGAVYPAAPEVPEVIDPPSLPAGVLLAWKPSSDVPPEVATLTERILHGDSSSSTMKALQKLTHKYPKKEELPYLLGQLYFTKLWVSDGLKSFRSAIQLNPMYRSNPFLLRAAISGLGNDSEHSQVRRFLTQDIGLPAVPYLEEALYGEWRTQVKERAAAIIREIQ